MTGELGRCWSTCLLLTCLLLFSLCTTTAATATTCDTYVAINGTDSDICGNFTQNSPPCATIQQGVDRVRDRGTVCVIADPLGTPYLCPDSGAGVEVDKSLNLISINGSAVIDCHGVGRALRFLGNADYPTHMRNFSLIGFTIQGGAQVDSSNGDGVVVFNASFTDASTLRARFEFADLSATVRDCTFQGNTGAILAFGVTNLLIEGCRFFNNSAGMAAASLSIIRSGIANVTNCHFSHFGGGGQNIFGHMFVYGGSVLHLSNSEFVDNLPSELAIFGTGLHAQSVASGVFVDRCSFINNTGSVGAAIAAVADTPLTITNCIFSDNTAAGQGGAIYVSPNILPSLSAAGSQSQPSPNNVTHTFINNTFINNSAQSGGAVAFAFSPRAIRNVSNNSIVFQGGSFFNNTARSIGGGGAVWILYPPEAPTVSIWCEANAVCNRTWANLHNTVLFDGVTFSNNKAECASCSGGALNLDSIHTSVKGCSFIENTAQFFGGAMVIQGESTSATITNSSFYHDSAVLGGGEFYSTAAGPLSVVDCVLEVEANDRIPFFGLPQGNLTSPTSFNNIYCSEGSQFVNGTLPRYRIERSPWGTVLTYTAFLSCLPCQGGTYSLDGGSVAYGRSSQHSISCHNCPGEADCSRGGADVYSLPGYWCHPKSSDSSQLECQLCPHDYCVEDSSSPWTDACEGNRNGTLCGECLEGYTLAFGSEECVPREDCDAASWFLPVVLLVGLLYVLLVVCFPINHHPLWKSIMYFMQVIPLLINLNNRVIRSITALFSLDLSILGVSVSVCPWADLNMVEKIASDYLLPAILFGVLLLLFLAHYTFKWFLSSSGTNRRRWHDGYSSLVGENELLAPEIDDSEEEDDEVVTVIHSKKRKHDDDDEEMRHPIPKTPYTRYASAFMGLTLFMYEGVTSATLSLLNCVNVGDDLRLFLAGTISCYAGWQYPLFALLAFVLLPFPLILVALRYYIHKYWPTNPYGHALVEVLEEPYARRRRWWESVGMLRRLILVSFATFILNAIWRSLALFAGCFFILAAHVYCSPYANKRYDMVETLFLMDLTLIAALDSPHAVFAYQGEVFTGMTADAIDYLKAILMLLPLAFCVLVVLCVQIPLLYDRIVALDLGWLRERLARLRREEDYRPALEEEPTNEEESEQMNGN